MSGWLEKAFGTVGTIVSEGRHELLSGWYGRHFEPHPSRPQAPEPDEPVPGERDIHGNERGIDR